MRKILKLVTPLLLICSFAIFAFATNITSDTSITDSYVTKDNLIVYNSADNYDIKELNAFLENGGIIIADSLSNVNVASNIDMSISTDNINDVTGEIATLGKDIATLYYKYGDNFDGIYVINVGINDVVDENTLIQEAVNIIRERQSIFEYATENSVAATTATSQAVQTLGIFDATYSREPKGKLRVSYEVFTLQNYNNLDFYIIKSKISGIPGCVLAETNSAYKSKYQIKELILSLDADSNSTTLDDFGPQRTVHSSTYTVDFGGQLDDTGTISINGGWSYSKTIEDTEIDVTFTTKLVEWDLTLTAGAQETSCIFYPAATYKCPSTKSSIQISANASCIFDSWDTLKETVSLNRNITITPSNASAQPE